MAAAIALRDINIGEHAGAYSPELHVYPELSENSVGTTTITIGGPGGSHQITLDVQQAKELAAVLSEWAESQDSEGAA